MSIMSATRFGINSYNLLAFGGKEGRLYHCLRSFPAQVSQLKYGENGSCLRTAVGLVYGLRTVIPDRIEGEVQD